MNNYPHNDYPHRDFPHHDYPYVLHTEGEGRRASRKKAAPDSDGLIFGLIAALLKLFFMLLKFILIFIYRGISLLCQLTRKP